MEQSLPEHALQALHAVDERIIQLLELRGHLAMQLAQTCLLDEQSSRARHSATIARLIRSNPGPLDEQRLAAIFGMVIAMTEPLSKGRSPSNGGEKRVDILRGLSYSTGNIANDSGNH